jgi:hypothetical protein
MDPLTGFYYVTYTAQYIGTFLLDIKIFTGEGAFSGTDYDKWEHIDGSPFEITVSGSATHTAGSTVEGTGLTEAVAGIQTYFIVTARDKYGNARTTGGDRFAAQMDGPMATAAVTKDLGDGRYNVTYTVTKKGEYKLLVGLVFGDKYTEMLTGSPFDVTVTKQTCPNDCNLNGVCEDDGTCTCTTEYEGEDCAEEITAIYMNILMYENIFLGSVLVIYICWVVMRDIKIKGIKSNDDSDSDEEEQFIGLACCMHW